MFPMLEAWVGSLVRELRSQMPPFMAKKKKKVANSNKWKIPNTSSDTIEKKTSELIS